jgi:phage terminase small subunit
MGLPKKLTEMQIKFAQLLVTNEGRKTPTECAIEAGYNKDRATIKTIIDEYSPILEGVDEKELKAQVLSKPKSHKDS